MKILIIGGTGLISTAITRDLLRRGDDVTLYNRGKSDAQVGEGAKFLYGDRMDYAAFEAQMADAGPFHCVMDMICYKPDDARSLARAFAGRANHLIVCSTVDVYAKPARRYPIREDEPHAPPDWDYAQNKEACEQILFGAQDRGDFPLTILRPAFTYGEGRGLVHTFGGSPLYLDRIRKGKPIVVHGDGSSLWTACHRDDVAHAFVACAGQPHTFGKTYNVAGEEWLTWNRYHETVAQAMNAPAPTLVHIPTDLLDKTAKRAHICAINFQYNNIFDNSAAHADLNFRYTIPFAEGVRRIVRWLDDHNKMPDSDKDAYDDRVIAAWQKWGANMAEAATQAEYEAARERMAGEQLAVRGIRDSRVLAAMRRVPRHRFVPNELAARAYEDCALPIGSGQTISQPLMVALILQALQVEGGERVLDVGTGSGYQAALLAEMGASVVSIERRSDLAAQARSTLASNGYERVNVVVGDGSQGYAPAAPYDRIAVAASSPHVPAALVEQLAPNGRLVLPIGSADKQYLTIVSKDAQGQVSTRTQDECQFVPLVGAQGWPEEPAAFPETL